MPYVPVTVTGYNSNPPEDDGSQVSTNEVEWQKHLDKIGGPLKTAIEATQTAVAAIITEIEARLDPIGAPTPQGRLSLSSTIPVLVSGVSAGTSVYYHPYVGDLIPVYNGTLFVPLQFTTLTLSLAAQHLANNIYDVFVFSDSGTLRLGTGPAWSVATAGSGARGTGAGTTELTRLNGFWVNAVQITARNGSNTYTVSANRGTYVGSIFIDGTNGQCTCSRSVAQNAKWGVWNAYNRMAVTLRVSDATASWTYASATVRQSNNSADNKVTVFCGLQEETIQIEFLQQITAPISGDVRIGIGVDSATSISGVSGKQVAGNDDAQEGTVQAQHTITGSVLGISNIRCLEGGHASTGTFTGGGFMELKASWRE